MDLWFILFYFLRCDWFVIVFLVFECLVCIYSDCSVIVLLKCFVCLIRPVLVRCSQNQSQFWLGRGQRSWTSRKIKKDVERPTPGVTFMRHIHPPLIIWLKFCSSHDNNQLNKLHMLKETRLWCHLNMCFHKLHSEIMTIPYFIVSLHLLRMTMRWKIGMYRQDYFVTLWPKSRINFYT